MKTTGIVRRVDDLGRIVIPREYRRAYDIEIGDPMEISADENGIISLRRVDTGAEYRKAACALVGFLHDQFGFTALVCDRRRFIEGAGKKKSVFAGADISRGIAKAISSCESAAIEPHEIFGECADDFSYGYVCPVTGEHGAEGALVVLAERPFAEQHKHFIELSARLIANNMQKY